ncbi:NAD(P)-binding protein [Byssothecium circinans]|uniref:Short-chain dehydrogenase/reductase 3 n=1 Tax=Byssothecium circinans TaxID=147558 RepID=A0A6A5TY29_9PLEO|nr:NAD(P)-binding protein [Byssothecium circinans]
MQAIRCLVVAAAYLAVLAAPSPAALPMLPLSDQHQATLYRVLHWLLALCLVREINSLLNAWAENKWLFKNHKSSWDWPNEIAVVTGGSGGIGAMIVKKLLSYGVKVAVFDIQPLSNLFTQEERASIKFYVCDVASPDAVHHAGEALRSDHGSPSILVNNAGIGRANTILETPPKHLQAVIGVNLLSQWYTIQEFLPDMIVKKKGHVLGIASMASFVTLAGQADYAATKAGVMALHEALTAELKHRYKCPEIKTSIVFPTWTKTRLTAPIEKGIRHSGATIHDPKDVAEKVVRQIIAAKSGQLLLGPSIVTAIRAMPTWVQEVLRDQLAQIVTGNTSTPVTL